MKELVHLILDLFVFCKKGELHDNLFLLSIVKLGTFLIGLLACAFDSGVSTLLGLHEYCLLHFLDPFLYVSGNHGSNII